MGHFDNYINDGFAGTGPDDGGAAPSGKDGGSLISTLTLPQCLNIVLMTDCRRFLLLMYWLISLEYAHACFHCLTYTPSYLVSWYRKYRATQSGDLIVSHHIIDRWRTKQDGNREVTRFNGG